MTIPAEHPLSLYEGDDTILRFWYHTAPNKFDRTDIQPVDLTGASIRLAAKRSITDDVPLFISDAELYNASEGKYAITFPSSATHGITQGKQLDLVYDMQLTEQGGLIHTILRGTFTIIPEVY